MGLIERTIGAARTADAIGDAARDLSEVFVPNATRSMELNADIHRATLETASSEYQHAGDNWFDRMINGLNRIPRPLLALGTIGLFVFAMIDPTAFATRMVGLAAVPEPLWWLLGAIVSFYFGARELHYFRDRPSGMSGFRAPWRRGTGPETAPVSDPIAMNPALSAWRNDGGQDSTAP
jgi:hypothetical protein